MELSIICFTKKGLETAKRIPGKLYVKSSRIPDDKGYTRVETSVLEWTGKQMRISAPILFVGAVGIAVRAVAPYVRDKLTDSPVVVVDEEGRFCIPLLSGHMGGANEIAVYISKLLGAIPVITTATDINGCFAVDVFAKKNGLCVMEREGIARVSSGILSGEEITLSVEKGHLKKSDPPEKIILMPYPPREDADVMISSKPEDEGRLLTLRPRRYVIGLGCKKNTDSTALFDFVTKELQKLSITGGEIYALASIDLKKNEAGMLALAESFSVPFLTYTAEELSKAEGEFTPSEFVREKTGVDNVCERAAYMGCIGKPKKSPGGCGAEEDGVEFIKRKIAGEGMTIAIAAKPWSVEFDHEE